MTQKLYQEDPYLLTCKAKVLSLNGRAIVLDQTVLFAFAGGQATDKGTIGGINVAQALDGEDITYILDADPPFKVGDSVDVIVDGTERDQLRRLHSAAHVVCGVFEKKTGVKECIGSNVSVRKARVDYPYPTPITPLLPDLEKEVNAFISAGHPVHVGRDPKDPKMFTWKSDFIEMHCCGTHVCNSKEIGAVRLKRANVGKGKERIEITLAG